MTIKSFVSYGIVAGALALCGLACSAAPENEQNASTEGEQALTNQCLPKFCMTGHHWNQTYCECLPSCVQTQHCETTAHWDPETCGCVQNCPQKVMCKVGYHWDTTVCHCVVNH